MAGFLTDSQIAQAGAAIEKTADTFFRTPVTITVRQDSIALDPFKESLEDSSSAIDYNLLCLPVASTSGESAEADKSNVGAVDLSEGYVLVKYSALDLLGLIVNEEPSFTPGSATLTLLNERKEILGINVISPLDRLRTLVKIHYRKEIKTHG